MTGTVKFWNDTKGFGFVMADGGRDYFIHHTKILDQTGRKTLGKGDRIEFDAGSTERGPVALGVRLIGIESADERA